MPPSGTSRKRLADLQEQFAVLLGNSPGHVFRQTDLRSLFNKRSTELDYPRSLTFSRMLSSLVEHGAVERIEIRPESTRNVSPIIRYVRGKPSAYEVGLSLKRRSYLTHASAIYLLGLNQQVPKTIYVNSEQGAKPERPGILSQEGIDRAFKGGPRESKYAFDYEGSRILMLSGKHTGRLEVTQIRTPDGAILDLTKLERTLIDSSVRPFYAGGVFQVLEAFRAARDRLSVNTLLATLRKLDYTYPYHQVIGFYMSRAGYNESQLERVHSFQDIRYDFYITYRLEAPDYDSTWKLFYPKGL